MIGVNFNDANGNILQQQRIDDIARDAQSNGLRSRQFLSPANADSATIWIWAGATEPGVDIPLRVRDVRLTPTVSSDTTPPIVNLVRDPVVAPTSTLGFTLEVTDPSGLLFIDGPNTEVTITGPNGYRFDLDSIAGTGITGGTAFFYELPPRTGGQWSSADNGVYTVTVNSDEFFDSVGNGVAEQIVGTFLIEISGDVA